MVTRLRIAGSIGIAIGVFAARALHLTYRDPLGKGSAVLPAVLLALLLIAVALIIGVPNASPRLSRSVTGAAGATVVGLGAAATTQLIFPASLPRYVVLVSVAFMFVALILVGAIGTAIVHRRGLVERVLAVLDPADGTAFTADALDQSIHEQPFTLIGVVQPDVAAEELERRTTSGGVTLLVLGPQAQISEHIVDHAERLHRSGLRVRTLDDFYDEWLGKLPLSSLDRFALMGDIESLQGGYSSIKRTIDVACALIGGVGLLVILPFVLLGNAIANHGPLLFRQPRVGHLGEEFSILKLRTMRVGAEDISGWTSNNDPRITGFGKALRRIHIDELPQVVNILRGQLSVVGPRPEQVRYVRELERKLPFYGARHLVTPGLTGWAQVKYRYAASEEDAYVKLQYDLHYLRHESLSTDLRIIWMTIRHLVVGGGR